MGDIMRRWQEVPASLDQRARQLVGRRRRFKAATGVGARDEAKDHGGADGAAGPGNRRTGGRTCVTIGCVSVLAAALVAVLLVTRPWQYEETGTGTVHVSAQPAFVFQRGQCHRCLVQRQAGELRAGYSTTSTVFVDVNSTGWEVIEAQCLLRYHGYDPGVPDGEYDMQAMNATERFQRDHGLVVDGKVGPDTWRELRRDDGRGSHGYQRGHAHRSGWTDKERPDQGQGG
ncbi:peptidoglycan-binding protein [Streptantibioticus rubrisoli]|uniref:Peptidoglycan-binding protein n=1 Tax=Streptantibioticus rubrisoli TaxID=1387313 RepID=A0ABT1PEB5_9ACTN|nr:peptidoglycan-binding domain-containing protein [Streptantibioticus rubrisoli]MCQ4042583.1 peptidoglycan-binding protein [Streptantibioticus rubrisoli]